jgi:glycerophosphodiester phosphodiesterase
MKFGKTLLSNQIPEWSRNYISYKAIKKEIKGAAANSPPAEEDITGKRKAFYLVYYYR